MVKIVPKAYCKYVIMGSKGKPLLYTQIKNALYGLLFSALLVYSKLVKDFEEYGFHINPYKSLGGNNMINDKHMRVVLHIVNLNASQVNSFEITKFSGYLSILYEGLTLHKVNVNKYLVIGLYYQNQVMVKVSIIRYIYIVIQHLPGNMGTESATSASDHLCKVLNEKKTSIYQRSRYRPSTK